jgi:hypothetical protein
MAQSSTAPTRISLQMVWFPALISLCVTILRLTGELRRWSPHWFSPETGGTDPRGVSWIIGITWLAVPFGIYFAWKLARAGHGPQSFGRVTLFGILGLFIVFCSRFLFGMFPGHFPEILIPLWLCWGASALLQYFGWPELFKALLAYGFLARIPVAVIMFFAMLIRNHEIVGGVERRISAVDRGSRPARRIDSTVEVRPLFDRKGQ